MAHSLCGRSGSNDAASAAAREEERLTALEREARGLGLVRILAKVSTVFAAAAFFIGLLVGGALIGLVGTSETDSGRVALYIGIGLIGVALVSALQTVATSRLAALASSRAIDLKQQGVVAETAEEEEAKQAYWKGVADKAVDTVFLILFLVYPSCSAIIFAAFDCESFDDGYA